MGLRAGDMARQSCTASPLWYYPPISRVTGSSSRLRMLAIKKGAHRPSGYTKRVHLRLRLSVSLLSPLIHPGIVRSSTMVITCERYHVHNFCPVSRFFYATDVLMCCGNFSPSVHPAVDGDKIATCPTGSKVLCCISNHRHPANPPFFFPGAFNPFLPSGGRLGWGGRR